MMKTIVLSLLLPGILFASKLSGKITDLNGVPLVGAQITLSSNKDVYTSLADGSWNLEATTKIVVHPCVPLKVAPNLFVKNGRVRFSFKGYEVNGRTTEVGLLEKLPPLPAFRSNAEGSEIMDTLNVSWNGKRLYTTLLQSGDSTPIAVRVDTAWRSDLGVAWNPKISYGSLRDERDGQVYRTVVIGASRWMAENMNFNATESWWFNGSDYSLPTGNFSYSLIHDSLNQGAKYGRFYTWASYMAFPDSCRSLAICPLPSTPHQGVCPRGWHVPSPAEWVSLQKTIFVDSMAKRVSGPNGENVRAATGWSLLNGIHPGKDFYGFRALASGDHPIPRLTTPTFEGASVGSMGHWWSTGQYRDTTVLVSSDSMVIAATLSNTSPDLRLGPVNMWNVNPGRCIEDSKVLPSERYLEFDAFDYELPGSYFPFSEATNGLLKGMVQPGLDSNRNLISTGSICPATSTVSQCIDPVNLPNNWFKKNDHNVAGTIRQKLTLNAANQMYEMNSPEYFPLDTASWSSAPFNKMNVHNFGFCFHSADSFKYQPKQVFNLTGDDDIWVFVNNKLVLDLGGQHGPMGGSIPLDSLSLTEGQSYPFDLFYCERHRIGSDLKISTSIYFDPRISHLTNPPIPTGVDQFTSDRKATVVWWPSAGATGYTVLRSNFSNGPFSVLATTINPSYVDSSVLDGQTYYYQVQANSPYGPSAPSITVAANVKAVLPVVTHLISHPFDKKVSIAWSPSNLATAYRVERGSDSLTFDSVGVVTDTLFVDTPLVNGVRSYYRIRVLRDLQLGNPSVAVPARPNPVLVDSIPSPPKSLTALLADRKVTLQWSLSSGATNYTALRSDRSMGPFTVLGTTKFTSFTDSTVLDGKAYFYQIKANSNGGSSAPDTISVIIKNVTLPYVKNLVASPGDQMVALSWTASNQATSYRLERGLAAFGTFDSLAEVAATNYVDTPLVNGTAYYYRIRPLRDFLVAPPDDSSVSAKPNFAPPAPVSVLTATGGDRTVTLNWTHVSGADGVRIYLQDMFQGVPIWFELATVKDSSSFQHTLLFDDSRLVNGTTYTYMVRSFKGSVESVNSIQVSATPVQPPAPPAVTGITVLPLDKSAQIDWSPVVGATSYEVWYRYSEADLFYHVAATGLTSTHFMMPNLVNGTAYRVAVVAVNPTGSSPASAEVLVTPTAVH